MCDLTKLEIETLSLSEDPTREGDHHLNDNDASVSLLDMPLEIFLKICTYLDADFISTLSRVCRRFEDILADGSLWRCWVSRRLKFPYPALRQLSVWTDEELNWEAACIDIDRETRRWRNVDKTMRYAAIKDVHYATIDSVLLINNAEFCVSGSRDRGLALWSVADIKAAASEGVEGKVSVQPLQHNFDAHKGWLWDLATESPTDAKTVYSGSWDYTVKSWDLATNLTPKQTFKCKMSVLSLVANGDLMMAGLYSRDVFIFDVRAGQSPIATYKQHRGPILQLQMLGDLVASLSEDKTIAIWDQKARKIVADNIKCTVGRDCYPTCFSWSSAAMYVGDSKSSLHLMNPETYEKVRTYELWQKPPVGIPANKVHGIYQTLGSLVVALDKAEFKCLYPSDPLEEYASFRSKARIITKSHYQNDVFVTGTCDSSLEFWIPGDITEP